MAVKTAPEIILKNENETRIINFDWSESNDLASGETLSSVTGTPVAAPVTSPTLAVTSPSVSGTIGQVTLGAGKAEQSFTGAAATSLLTKTSHGLSDGFTVRVAKDGLEDLPTGIDEATLYYVVTSLANTFQLALTTGGTPITLTDDGQGTVYIEYRVSFRTTTSLSQVLDAEGICGVRT